MAQDADPQKADTLHVPYRIRFNIPINDQIRLINRFFFPTMWRSRKFKVNGGSKLIEIIKS